MLSIVRNQTYFWQNWSLGGAPFWKSLYPEVPLMALLHIGGHRKISRVIPTSSHVRRPSQNEHECYTKNTLKSPLKHCPQNLAHGGEPQLWINLHMILGASAPLKIVNPMGMPSAAARLDARLCLDYQAHRCHWGGVKCADLGCVACHNYETNSNALTFYAVHTEYDVPQLVRHLLLALSLECTKPFPSLSTTGM